MLINVLVEINAMEKQPHKSLTSPTTYVNGNWKRPHAFARNETKQWSVSLVCDDVIDERQIFNGEINKGAAKIANLTP